jgi:hypothetical protein
MFDAMISQLLHRSRADVEAGAAVSFSLDRGQ